MALLATTFLAGPLRAEDGPALPIRFGTHPTFERMVFDWSRPVEYRVESAAGAASVSFDRPAEIDVKAVTATLAKIAAGVEVSSDERLALRFTLPDGMRVRHFRSGTKVVLDFTRAPDAGRVAVEQVRTPAGAQAAALAPPTPAPAPVPAPAPASAPAPEARRPIPLHPPVEASAPAAAAPSPAAASAEPAPPPRIAVDLVRTPDGQGLRFAWPEAVGAAAFGRGTSLWIVFDRAATFDLDRLHAAGDVLGPVDVVAPVAGGAGVALRLAPAAGTGSLARREGDAWVVEVGRTPRVPDVSVSVSARNAADPKSARVVAELPGARMALEFADPEIGDRLIAVPTAAVGYGLDRDRDFAQFRLLATVQGLAVAARADAVSARPAGHLVEIANANGLWVSDLPSEDMRGKPLRPGATLFDFASWRRGGAARFSDNRQALHRAVAEAPEGKRNAARLQLMRFLFSFGHFTDVLGLARLIDQDEPALVATAQVRAMRGVAALMSGELDEAQRQLSHPSLDSYGEAALWRGALAMAQGNARAARAQIARGGELFESYPAPFANQMRLWSAEAQLQTGDSEGAARRLDTVLMSRPTAGDAAMAMYLRGRIALAGGDRDGALAVWRELEKGPISAGRTAAVLGRIELLLEDGKLPPAEAIAALERLRLTWRGDDLEFRTLVRLGRLQLASGDVRTGLQQMRQAVTLFPEQAAAADLSGELVKAFARVIEDRSPAMTPVAAVAMFEEFRDLIPPGELGDDLSLALADRLIGLDLLDRADGVLDRLVRTRLSGVRKAQAGARLAMVRLLDRRSEAALEAIDASAAEGLPEGLVRERAQIGARALALNGRAKDALDLIAGDDSREADLVRSEIQWQAQDWKGAAETLSRLVGSVRAEQGLTDEQARQVLQAMVAAALADDRTGLARLDERLGEAMRKSAYKDVYAVLAARRGSPAATVQEIAARVATAVPFQSFMAGYRQRLAGAAKAGT